MNAATNQATAAPASGWSNKPIDRAELIGRIDSAIRRITSGSCSMRVPAESDDPDLVLADCKKLLQAEPLPQDPPLGLIMSMAIRYDHGLGVPGYYDGALMRSLSLGITHKQRLVGTMATMRQLYEEVSGQGFYRPELEESYALRAAQCDLGDVNDVRELTSKDLQHAVQGAASKLVQMANKYGVVLTIEHRRTPDARPAQYVIDTRPTRAVYEKKTEQPQQTEQS